MTKASKNVILSSRHLMGWQYGSQFACEDALARHLSGTIFPLPQPSNWSQKFGHGTRYSLLRHLELRQRISIGGDSMWLVLMNPNDFCLDRFNGWKSQFSRKVLYLIDAYFEDISLLKGILASTQWDVLLTPFVSLVPWLNQRTGRRWGCLPLAADAEVFRPAPLQERVIAFSSYGRRSGRIHELVKQFCDSRGLYYDYTTLNNGLAAGVTVQEQYRQYAFHLSRSVFNVNCSVEATMGRDLGGFSPITSRWYEAAAAATPMVGVIPTDSMFSSLIPTGLLHGMDVSWSDSKVLEFLGELWQNRVRHHEVAAEIYRKLGHTFDWSWRLDQFLKEPVLATARKLA